MLTEEVGHHPGDGLVVVHDEDAPFAPAGSGRRAGAQRKLEDQPVRLGAERAAMELRRPPGDHQGHSQPLTLGGRRFPERLERVLRFAQRVAAPLDADPGMACMSPRVDAHRSERAGAQDHRGEGALDALAIGEERKRRLDVRVDVRIGAKAAEESSDGTKPASNSPSVRPQ